MRGFHTQDNLFFERLEGGGVRVTKYPDEARWLSGIEGEPTHEPLFVQDLDADTWCSVIASMSAGGEHDERFYLAGKFHRSEGRQQLRQIGATEDEVKVAEVAYDEAKGNVPFPMRVALDSVLIPQR